MIAKFNVNGTIVSYDNIVDVDLSMYDEIMVSSMSSPEFSVTFACNFLDRNVEGSFAYWWYEIKHLNPEITLVDSSGNNLASGLIFEYEELYEDFKLRLTAKNVYLYNLQNTIEIDHSFSQLVYASPYSNYYSERLVMWLNQLWNKANIGVGLNFAGSPSQFIQPLINMYLNKGGYMYIRSVFYGTRAEFIKQFAIMLNAKAIFVDDYEYSHVTFAPFTTYSNPIEIQGYLKTSTKETQELSNKFDFNLIQAVRLVKDNSDPDHDVYDYFTDRYIQEIKDRYTIVEDYTSYEIFGFDSRIINTGETISLDGTQYYVKEISYDMERLNDIKSFNCVGVRFTQ